MAHKAGDISQQENISTIKSWVLEFALKYSLYDVIEVMDTETNFKDEDLLHYSADLSMLAILERSWRYSATYNDEQLLHPLWLPHLLKDCSTMARKARQTGSDPSTVLIAVRASIALKLLDLLQMLKSGVSPEVVGKLHEYFPPLENSDEVMIQPQVGDQASAERAAKQAARERVQKLLLNETRRKNYYSSLYGRDFTKLHENIRDDLRKLQDLLFPSLPQTALENVLCGARSDLLYNSDPAIQALLAHLPASDDVIEILPETLQPELICLVHLLDSGNSELVCSLHNSDSFPVEESESRQITPSPPTQHPNTSTRSKRSPSPSPQPPNSSPPSQGAAASSKPKKTLPQENASRLSLRSRSTPRTLRHSKRV